MNEIPVSQKFTLKFNDSLCTCEVCGAEVESLNEGKGEFVLCSDHNTWRTWFTLWRAARR